MPTSGLPTDDTGADTIIDRAAYVEDVMSPHAVTVHPEADLADAVELIT